MLSFFFHEVRFFELIKISLSTLSYKYRRIFILYYTIRHPTRITHHFMNKVFCKAAWLLHFCSDHNTLLLLHHHDAHDDLINTAYVTLTYLKHTIEHEVRSFIVLGFIWALRPIGTKNFSSFLWTSLVVSYKQF